MTEYEKALRVAVTAHQEQVRKSDSSPYIVHPIMVSRLLETHGFAGDVLLAALLHDVVEDTAVTEADLRAQFADSVVDIVMAVSEDQDLLWRERKEQYIAQVVAAEEEVKALSVADKIHNAESLIDHHSQVGAEAWSVYSKPKDEKLWFEETLHAELSKVWQHPLLDTYAILIVHLQQISSND